MISPGTTPGVKDATKYNHYSMLRTTEEMLGQPTTVGGAASAPSMRAGFGL